MFDFIASTLCALSSPLWLSYPLSPYADYSSPCLTQTNSVMPKRSHPNNARGSKGSKCSKVVSKSTQGSPMSKRNRPGQYRQYDQGTAFIRSHLICGLANQLISHRRENGGTTQRGFLKGLLVSANDANSQLEITRNDINNPCGGGCPVPPSLSV